ncbi:polyprenyl synthetase family protein [Corynebacterium sp. MC-17D]|uniref:Polyprenyl synthetase family protein n=1 Tax=Corynebacterium lipophilum TaxID=2804918 RepID=A0AAW5HUU0_9CORY|nr:polyprenyl synthetase family protein [Corynebacterium lipophilum]MCO6393959.1 polyprenyl synthetase family protein [Corynebacterium lipophilum]MCZ2116147.1 polyprenyl synthetase family protein [Corynebacterium lipophilum]
MTNGITPSPRHGFRMDLGDDALTERVTQGMGEVETLLRERLQQGEAFITDKVMHLAAAGGKRFRPLVALLCSEFGPNPGATNVIKGATITEMVHLATLYHDDVMDEAEKRRGVDSANMRWSNTVAILAGDILFAHASRLMSEIDTATVAHFADTFQGLVTGQMRETVGAQGEDPVEHYLKVIDGKTAVLIASAAHLGSLHAGASRDIVESCSRMGNAIGMIFQIVDDIIDIFSDSAQSGKTPGTDLREGVFTLPVLYALEEDSPAGEALRGLLTGPLDNDADVERAIALLRQTQGRQRSLDTVQEYLDIVERELDFLPDGPANQALRQVSAYAIERVG